MDADLLTVSRLQFATTVAFHMTFPAVTIGLSLWLVILYGLYLWRGDEGALKLYNFWKKIFALGFGLGVVAGTVITFEFGLNWAHYASAVGPILGVIINMEVITAFFLEAGFIGLLLYGDRRLSKGTMMFATCMVALGTVLSSTWILSANSWMQFPAGAELVRGQFQVTNWWQVIFNPTFLYRYPHMLLGALIAASLFFTGVGAYYLRRRIHLALARRMFALGLAAVGLLIPVQIWMGDEVAQVMGGHQPAKVQALEGNWNSTNTGYNLLIVPDQAHQTNRFQLTLPYLGAIVLGHDLTTPVPGLAQTPRAEQPPMGYVFYGFRSMYYVAIITFAMVVTGMLLRLRGELYRAHWFHTWALWMLPAGVVAIIGGWVTAETGRQPYVVYGQLRTADAVSNLTAGAVWTTFALFVLLYLGLLGVYVYYVRAMLRQGPDDARTLVDNREQNVRAPSPERAAKGA